MDVNEQIAKAYFEERHGYIVKTNHYYKKIRDTGTGPSDIDLVLIKPIGKGKYGKKAICTVKGWQSHRIKLDDIKNENVFTNKWRIFENEEIAEADKIFGKNKYSKILIMPPVRPYEKEEAIEYLKSKNILLLDFSDILCELLQHISLDVNKNRAYDSQALQILRMIALNVISITDEGKIHINRSIINRYIDRRYSLNKSCNISARYKNNSTNKYIEI